MYNYKKLGSFLDLKSGSNTTISKQYARKVYPDANNAVVLDGKVYFVLSVTWEEPDSLMPEPMEVCKIIFEVPQDQGRIAKIYMAHTFTLDTLSHPDYNGNVRVLKGTLNGFLKDAGLID